MGRLDIQVHFLVIQRRLEKYVVETQSLRSRRYVQLLQ